MLIALKNGKQNFDLIMDLTTIVSRNKFGGPNDTVWICEVCLSIFSLSKKSWQMDDTLAKTKIMYPKNMRAKAAMDFT